MEGSFEMSITVLGRQAGKLDLKQTLQTLRKMPFLKNDKDRPFRQAIRVDQVTKKKSRFAAKQEKTFDTQL